jgi:hypothetical protein
MARSSSTKLTKYITSTTIITADVANMWFGGLYGSSEGSTCEANDPLVAGHIHDGANQDGHAQQINLTSHVTGELRNSNLADNAVIKRNIQSFLDQGSAIPESEIIDGSTYYYLDLSDIRTEIANNGALITISNITSNSPGTLATDDFVFGSDSLDDDTIASHFNRITFDKSKAAFRAGRASGTEWDDVNRGSNSTAFGRDNTAAAAISTVAGGDNNSILVTGTQSFIGGGSTNVTESLNTIIGSGNANSIGKSSPSSIIGSGSGNTIDGSVTNGAIVGGNLNNIGDGITAVLRAGILAGQSNTVNGSNDAAIVGGSSNTVESAKSFIGAGTLNIAGSNLDPTNSANSVVVGGASNEVYALNGFVGSGSTNVVGVLATPSASARSSIISGEGNNILGSISSLIGSGDSNIIDTSDYGVVVGGESNEIDTSEYCFIGGGEINTIGVGSDHSSIVGGDNNTVGAGCLSSNILGGASHDIGAGLDFCNVIGGDLHETTGGISGHGNYATILGGRAGQSRHSGEVVFPSARDGVAEGARGSHQTSRVHWVGETVGLVTEEIFIDGTDEQLVLPDNSSYHFEMRVCGKDSGTTNIADYSFNGAIIRGVGVATATLVYFNKTVLREDVGAWDVALAADVTSGSLTVTVTGDTGDNILWIASAVIHRLDYV